MSTKFTGVKKESEIVLQSRKYNDIVGWIVISIWLGRIRAEYWFVEQRVIIGLRNKTFDNRGKLFVYKFGQKVNDSNVIYNELSSLLKRSASEVFPKREVDYECFESIGPYIDWKSLLMEYSSNNQLQATQKPRA